MLTLQAEAQGDMPVRSKRKHIAQRRFELDSRKCGGTGRSSRSAEEGQHATPRRRTNSELLERMSTSTQAALSAQRSPRGTRCRGT
jgi:hypothetical protein